MTKNNNTDNWNKEIGSRLLELRKHYGCSQREMAEKVEISINTYGTGNRRDDRDDERGAYDTSCDIVIFPGT